MIKGIGTDIAEISRIESALSRFSDKFAQRILTDSEFAKFKQHPQQAQYLAKRFSAKEAASKALGLGIAGGITFKDFEISNDQFGAPKLILKNKALEVSQQKGVNQIDISLSDEKHYALAFVVLSGT